MRELQVTVTAAAAENGKERHWEEMKGEASG